MVSFCQQAGFRRLCSPACGGVSQRRTLLIFIGQHRLLVREMVNSTALYNGPRLAAVKNPVRMFCMVFVVIFFSIIIACNFYNICTLLRIFPGHIIRTNGNGCILFRVIFLYFVHQYSGPLLALFTDMGIINLISDTPENQTWVIPVSLHPGFYVPFIPLREKTGVIIRCLGRFPHIKGFRYD